MEQVFDKKKMNWSFGPAGKEDHETCHLLFSFFKILFS
jgi:hypothetical protein